MTSASGGFTRRVDRCLLAGDVPVLPFVPDGWLAVLISPDLQLTAADLAEAVRDAARDDAVLLLCDGPLGEELAAALGRPVVAPDGPVVQSPGGILVTTDAAGGWWRHRPGQASEPLGPRWPAPGWQGLVPAATPWPAAVIARPVPTGWLLSPGPVSAAAGFDGVEFAVAVDPERPRLLLDPGLTGDLLALAMAALPTRVRRVVDLVPLGAGQGAGRFLAADAARRLGEPVHLVNGVPLHPPAGPITVFALDAHRRPVWSEPAWLLRLTPDGGEEVVASSPPHTSLRAIDPATYAMDMGWQVRLSGGGIHAFPGPPPPPAKGRVSVSDALDGGRHAVPAGSSIEFTLTVAEPPGSGPVIPGSVVGGAAADAAAGEGAALVGAGGADSAGSGSRSAGPAGVEPAHRVGVEPAVAFGAGPAGVLGAGPAVPFGVEPASGFGPGQAGGFGAGPAVPFGAGPAGGFEAGPAVPFGAGPAGAFGLAPAGEESDVAGGLAAAGSGPVTAGSGRPGAYRVVVGTAGEVIDDLVWPPLSAMFTALLTDIPAAVDLVVEGKSSAWGSAAERELAERHPGSDVTSGQAREFQRCDLLPMPPAPVPPDPPAAALGARNSLALLAAAAVVVLLLAVAGVATFWPRGGDGTNLATGNSEPQTAAQPGAGSATPAPSTSSRGASPKPSVSVSARPSASTQASASPIPGTPSAVASAPPLPLDDSDAAAGRPTSESSHTDVYGANRVTDRDPMTYWESRNNALPQWVQVDLGAPVAVRRIVLRLPPSAAWPARTQSVTVLGSLDGSSFTTISGASCRFDAGNGQQATLGVGAGQHRYIRVVISSNSVQPAGQLSSVEVYRS